MLQRVSNSLTSVLLSSIFFIADSVVRGNFTIWKASSFCAGGALQYDTQHSQQVHWNATNTDILQ